jgi:hypothetical protein
MCYTTFIWLRHTTLFLFIYRKSFSFFQLSQPLFNFLFDNILFFFWVQIFDNVLYCSYWGLCFIIIIIFKIGKKNYHQLKWHWWPFQIVCDTNFMFGLVVHYVLVVLIQYIFVLLDGVFRLEYFCIFSSFFHTNFVFFVN